MSLNFANFKLNRSPNSHIINIMTKDHAIRNTHVIKSNGFKVCSDYKRESALIEVSSWPQKKNKWNYIIVLNDFWLHCQHRAGYCEEYPEECGSYRELLNVRILTNSSVITNNSKLSTNCYGRFFTRWNERNCFASETSLITS